MTAIAWQGYVSPAGRMVCVRPDSAGAVIDVVCNGATTRMSEIDAPSSNIQRGLVPLPVGMSNHEAVVYVDGVEQAERLSLRSYPSVGQGFKVAWLSCIQLQSASTIPLRIAADPTMLLMMALGDTPYADDPGSTYWGVTWTTISTDPSFTNWSKPFEGWHRNPYIKKMGHQVGILRMPNDHDFADNFDPDDAMWANLATGKSVVRAWSAGNPPNTDAGIDSGALYSRFAIGPLECWLLDTQTHKSRILATDDASKFLLGSTQQDWLTDTVTAATATWKAIAHGYRMGSELTDHVDGWKNYQTAETALHAAIAGVNGIIHLEGDFHAPSASVTSTGPAVNACPAGVNALHSIGAGYGTNMRYKMSGQAGSTAGVEYVYGEIEVMDGWETAYIRLIDQSGSVRLEYEYPAGASAVAARRSRFG